MPLLIDTPEVLCASQVAERYRSEWNPTGITRDCQPKTRGELHVGAKSPNWRSHGSPAHSPVGRSDPAGPPRPPDHRELHRLEGQAAHAAGGGGDGGAAAARDRPPGRDARARSAQRGGPVRLAFGVGEAAPAGRALRPAHAAGGVNDPRTRLDSRTTGVPAPGVAG